MVAMETTLTIPLNGLRAAAEINLDRFTFVMGEKEFDVSRFQACLLSSKVQRMLAGDVMCNRMEIDAMGYDESNFELMVALMNGHSVVADGKNADFLRYISGVLDNYELSEMVKDVQSEEMTMENVLDRLKRQKIIGGSTEKEMAFIASHFYDFIDKIDSVCDFDEIETILESDDLRIVDEASMLWFACRHKDKSGTLRFLRHVRPEFLPGELVEQYLSYTRECDTDDVWYVLSRCLCQHMHSDRNRERELSSGRFVESEQEQQIREEQEKKAHELVELKRQEYAEQDKVTEFKESPRGGIFEYLRRKCGGNVHEKGTVNVSASGNYNHSKHPYQITDREWSDIWQSYNEPNSWIMFDFKQQSVCPTHYSLRYSKALYPKNWQLQGSDDGDSWAVIDHRDTEELSDKNIHAFSCEANSISFRFLRVVQTGQNPNGTHFLSLSEIEFFGSMRLRDEQRFDS